MPLNQKEYDAAKLKNKKYKHDLNLVEWRPGADAEISFGKLATFKIWYWLSNMMLFSG